MFNSILNFRHSILIIKNLVLLFLIASVLFAGSCTSEGKKHAEEELYYCPMHPEETSDEMDKCNICGMDMEKDHQGSRQHVIDSIAASE